MVSAVPGDGGRAGDPGVPVTLAPATAATDGGLGKQAESRHARSPVVMDPCVNVRAGRMGLTRCGVSAGRPRGRNVILTAAMISCSHRVTCRMNLSRLLQPIPAHDRPRLARRRTAAARHGAGHRGGRGDERGLLRRSHPPRPGARRSPAAGRGPRAHFRSRRSRSPLRDRVRARRPADRGNGHVSEHGPERGRPRPQCARRREGRLGGLSAARHAAGEGGTRRGGDADARRAGARHRLGRCTAAAGDRCSDR